MLRHVVPHPLIKGTLTTFFNVFDMIMLFLKIELVYVAYPL